MQKTGINACNIYIYKRFKRGIICPNLRNKGNKKTINEYIITEKG